MNNEVTVKSIREAQKDSRMDLIVRYICDKRSDAIISSSKQIRVLTMISCLMDEDIEMDRYATLRFYPSDNNENAYDFFRNYFGLDTTYPMAIEEIWQKYPELYHSESYKDIRELEVWYESIAIQILIHVRDRVTEAEKRIAEAEEERARLKAKSIAEEEERRKYLDKHRGPIIRNKWILPGKMDEFYRRRMERLYKAK